MKIYTIITEIAEISIFFFIKISLCFFLYHILPQGIISPDKENKMTLKIIA